MSRITLLRLLDSFFRRWPLYLIPFVLFAGLGLISASSAKEAYSSTGVLYAETDTLLSQLTSVREDGFTYETPASVTTRSINDLLSTDDFVLSIADGAGVADDIEAGTLTIASIRSSISTRSSGYNLVTIEASSEFPDLALALADSTISTYRTWVIDTDVSDSQAAETFFLDLRASYDVQLTEARATLDEYLTEHPDPAVGERPLTEKVEIDRLTGVIQADEARVAEVQANIEESRLALNQARSDVEQRLRLVDVPQQPSAPEPLLKTRIITLMVFFVLGSLFTLAAVVAGYLIDPSIRIPMDVGLRLGAPLIGVLPDVKRVFRPTPVPKGAA